MNMNLDVDNSTPKESIPNSFATANIDPFPQNGSIIRLDLTTFFIYLTAATQAFNPIAFGQVILPLSITSAI